jgi:hypothetical protein
MSILNSVGTPYIEASLRRVTAPLPSLQQGSGHKIGFFEQGLVTGGVLIFSSLITLGVAAGYHFWRM